MLVDHHCHLDFPQFSDRSAVVERARTPQRFEFGTYIDKTDTLVDGYPVRRRRQRRVWLRRRRAQPFANPQWAFVTPFALTRADAAINVDGR